MIKEMEKALKRYLKGKNRIIMGVVVAFLLGSSFAFGDVTIKYEGSTIKILDKSGNVTEIGTVTKNSANEFTWTLPEGVDISETVKIDDTVNANNIKVNIVNNGNIDMTNSSGNQDYTGNGIVSNIPTDPNISTDSPELNSLIGNIINNGTIVGSSSSGKNSGNGIFAFSEAMNYDKPISTSLSSTIGNIINYETINGTGNGDYSGNGIYAYSSSYAEGDSININNSSNSAIGNITNYGKISGNSTSGAFSGNGIYASSNTSAHSGSFNGEALSISTIGNILNYGDINGTTTSTVNGSGNGIYYSSESYFQSDTSSSNGSRGKTISISKIGNIINNGKISGNSTSGSNSGNGIYSYSLSISNALTPGTSSTATSNSIIGNITNYGTISGSSTDGYDSGNAIHAYSNADAYSDTSTAIATSSSIIGNITNYGTISGSSNSSNQSNYNSGNAIFAYSEVKDDTTTTSSSIIGNITNYGIISGSSTDGYDSGNAIHAYSTKEATIGDVVNYGTIKGKDGISSYSENRATIGDIANYGIISSTRNGINIESYGVNIAIGDITNNGIISASNSSSIYAYTDFTSTIGKIINRGNIAGGIYSSTQGSTIESISNTGVIASAVQDGICSTSSGGKSTIKLFSNSGVIMGGDNGIYINGDSNSGINDYNNYGLVIGQTPVLVDKDGSGTNTFSDPQGQGMAITLESDGSIKTNGITSGTGGKAGIYSIINTTLQNGGVDAYNEYTTDENISNSIINGAGVASGTVTIEADKNFSLNGGIINAYKTAVTVKDGASFTGTDVTINGGGLDGTALVISGSAGANTVNISGNSFINGDIDLKGTGDGDTLNFGLVVSRAAGSDNINLFHKISNVENININQKVTAFETSEIKGADKINIGKNGELVLRIDGTNSNKHALSNGNSSGTIDSDGGKLLLALNGVSDGSTIDMGIKLGDGIYGVENPDIKYRDLFTLETTSYLHSLRKTGEKEVTVETKSTLPLSYTNYYRLNKIYQSMRTVDGIKEFNVDTDEKFSSFIGYLNDIYAGNPYSYSSELSRKSMGMFRDIVTENSFKADTGKWMIYGGLTHIDGGTKDTYYGKGYYTYDIGSSDIDSDTKITGAYMLGEYGVSDDFKAGVAVGGNKLKSDLSNDSKVDGDALYIGGYAKKYLGNLKVTAGAGFQYGDYDADRTAAGREITETRSYSSSYNDLTYDIYLNGRYSHNIGDNLYLEPYGTLSYTYVKQDGADEGNKTLAIETDSKSFDYTSAKVGLDLKKVIPHEKGKSTLSVGASYTRLLNGADEEYITGRFKGGSDFDILVVHKNEHSLGLNAKYTLELENGILFDVKGTYSIERDSHNQSGKNKTKGEWIVGTGLGYKF
ncbi:hypothetical protein FV113G1_24090 [Fusobacterium varium]|nr:hypothetical protein FV113G1_24090 [Fusobacterium varium]